MKRLCFNQIHFSFLVKKCLGGDGEAYILISMYWCSLSKKKLAGGRTYQTFVLMKTSWRRLPSSSSEDVLVKTNIFVLAIRLQDVFRTSCHNKTSCKNVFKTSSRRLQDVLKTSSRHLQDVLQRYLQDVFKTYHQVKLFLLTSLRDVFNKFLRYTAKTVIYRRICLGHTCEKFMVIVQNLQKW